MTQQSTDCHNGNCKGCVCDILRGLVDNKPTCNNNTEPFYTLILEDGTQIQNLKFIAFLENSCCAKFEEINGRIIFYDCQKLAGIQCQAEEPFPPLPPEGVACSCSGTITAGGGTPGTFSNSNVMFIVPMSSGRNVEGNVDIVCNCTTNTVNQSASSFSFMVPPKGTGFGFMFDAQNILFTECSNSNTTLTVRGSGIATPQGGSGPSGVYEYTLVLNEPTTAFPQGSITITLRNPQTGEVVFQTVPFSPTNGAGKMVTITPC